MENTYDDLKKLCYHYGFISCPIDSIEFEKCRQFGLTMAQIYMVCCDVNADLEIDKAIFWNMSMPVPTDGNTSPVYTYPLSRYA